MASQVKGSVLVGIVRFLEDRDVVGATFVEIFVVFRIDRVDFHVDDPEILAGNLDGVADVFDIAHLRAFAGEHDDFFDTRIGDVLTFAVEFFVRQAGALDLVVRVEAAVDAVVIAVVGEIDRRQDGDVVAEMAPRDQMGFLGHFFQERCSGRR